MTSTIRGSEGRASHGGLVVGVLAFGGIAVSIMQTLVVPLIPKLPTLLHTSASNAFWAITATLLAAAAAVPMLGRLGDMYGKRRMLLVSLGLLVVGSVISGLSSSLIPMVIGRALQGCSMAVIPLGISIMSDELPREKVGSSIALMSASLGVGGALGLPAAALIAEYANWHVLFWGSAGLGAVVAVLVLAVVRESPLSVGGRFDLLGAIGLGAGLVSLLLPISKGADWGWHSGATLGLFVAAVVILLLWGWWELRTSEPLVDLRTTARRPVLMTNIVSIAVGFGMYAMSLVLPQLLEMPKATGYGLGQSLVVAGLCLAPGGLIMMVISPFSARLSAKFGPKVSLMVGALVMAGGYSVGLLLMSAVWQVIVFSAVISVGIGFAYAAMPSLITSAVPPSETAAANGLNSLFRSIGTTSSSAVIGLVLANMTTRFGPYTLPSQNGFRVAVIIGGAGALLAFLLAAFIPGRRPAAESADFPADGSAVDRSSDPNKPESNGHQPVGIHGRVHRSDGVAIGGAALTLIDTSGRQVQRSASGDDGEYQLAAPAPGSYVLIVAARAHQPDASTVTVGFGPTALDVVLAGAGGLSGTVSLAGSGAPIPGALATLADDRGEVIGSARTGADGRYLFSELVAGPYTLVVSADSGRLAALAVSVPSTGEGIQDVELVGGARLHGVARTVDGRVVPDARITLLDQAGNIVGVTTTDDAGEYRLSAVPEGHYMVIASGYPPVTSSLNVSGGQNDEHDVLLGHIDEWAMRDDDPRSTPQESSLPRD